jgi:hypothetical protein
MDACHCITRLLASTTAELGFNSTLLHKSFLKSAHCTFIKLILAGG